VVEQLARRFRGSEHVVVHHRAIQRQAH
jgi:hypothetical protein